jgi:hypothetical protein
VATKQARVNTGKLTIDDAHELLIAWRVGAVWRRRYNASADIVGVARVLAVRDCRGDEISLVCDTSGLGKVDHVVCVVLLIADVSCGKKRVDTTNAGKLHAWVVGSDVTATDEL